ESARGASPRLEGANCLIRLPFGDEASPALSATGRRNHTATAPTASLRLRAGCLVLLICALALTAVGADHSAPDADAIRTAVTKSLPLLTAGARGSMEERERCFTCHNQGLPIMALTTAQARGFAID